jgi:hypothetical protein
LASLFFGKFLHCGEKKLGNFLFEMQIMKKMQNFCQTFQTPKLKIQPQCGLDYKLQKDNSMLITN